MLAPSEHVDCLDEILIVDEKWSKENDRHALVH